MHTSYLYIKFMLPYNDIMKQKNGKVVSIIECVLLQDFFFRLLRNREVKLDLWRFVSIQNAINGNDLCSVIVGENCGKWGDFIKRICYQKANRFKKCTKFRHSNRLCRIKDKNTFKINTFKSSLSFNLIFHENPFIDMLFNLLHRSTNQIFNHFQ